MGLKKKSDDGDDRSFWDKVKDFFSGSGKRKSGGDKQDSSDSGSSSETARQNQKTFNNWQSDVIDSANTDAETESNLRDELRDSDPDFADKYDRYLKGDVGAPGTEYWNASVELGTANAMVESMMEVLRYVEDQGTLGNLVDLKEINKTAIGVIRGQKSVQSYIAPIAYAGLALGQMRSGGTNSPSSSVNSKTSASYRYAGEGEAAFAEKNGYVPN